MFTIHGRASKGESDNAKLMYWFPLASPSAPSGALAHFGAGSQRGALLQAELCRLRHHRAACRRDRCAFQPVPDLRSEGVVSESAPERPPRPRCPPSIASLVTCPPSFKAGRFCRFERQTIRLARAWPHLIFRELDRRDRPLAVVGGPSLKYAGAPHRARRARRYPLCRQ
jgi:hypothetical protein